MEDQGVWEVVEPSGEAPTGATALAAAKAKDIKAKAHLLQCLPDDLLMQVADKKTGKEVWDSLQARYVGEERVKDARLQTLKSEFDNLKMKENESVDSYAGKLSTMAVKFASLGGSLDDAALVKKMFDTIPERFIHVVAGIEQFFDLKKIAFDEAVGRLKAFKERIRRGSSGPMKTEDGQVLLTQAEWEARQKQASGESSGKSSGGRGRGRGRGGGRAGRGDGGRDGSVKRDKSHVKCFKCHEKGHYANRCPGTDKNADKKKEEAHHVKAVEYEPTVLLAETAMPCKLEQTLSEELLSDDRQLTLNEVKICPELHYTSDGVSYGDVWYLDNGASNHMTGDREKFREIDPTVAGKVTFGDGSSVEIKGKGSIVFQGQSRDQWVLYDVYYIPKLKSNLVSSGQLTEIGHRVLMDDNLIEVAQKNPEKMIMRVQRSVNRLYKVELKTANPVSLLANVNDVSWLWHGRLGHVNFQSLKMLVDKEMAGGIPLIDHPDQVCQSCLAAKQTRCSFPQVSRWRADEPLELIHIDLCGPITPETEGKSKYFMLMVDDCIRWMTVSILKTKDQAVEAFAKFKAEAENTLGYKVKCVRSDRGGEFLAAAFKEIYENAGIKRQLTAPFTPQQNGVVERRNRTVMEMARSIMKSMRVPGRFWGEAVRHSVHLLNRLPTRPMGSRTPFEAWSGRKP